jgi:urea carboxylase
MQARVHAEDPGRNDQPSAGLLTDLRFPGNTRIDTWVERGTEITTWYDPLLATVTVLGQTRQNALARLSAALQSARITGIETNLAFLRSALAEPAFLAGLHTSRLLDGLRWHPPVVHVIESGVQSTVQDWPGRIGYADVGVPPSGPMDEFAFRVANGLVGNERSGTSRTTAGIECAMAGPTLRFDCDAVIAVTGAAADLTLNDEPLEMWTSHAITAGSVLKVGRIAGPGCRAYIAVAGGLDVPAHLGSRATFLLGRFGGHAGRSLRAGDVLHLAQSSLSATLLSGAAPPEYPQHWTLGVLLGPHAAPDPFTPGDIEQLLGATWTVHFNSSRAGLRLVGPRPHWARPDGGEAGLHPSNVLETPSAPGAIQFAGEQPLIVGPDGPTLTAHATPAVVAPAEQWKLGQIRPGDTIRFRLLGSAAAAELSRRLEQSIASFELPPSVEEVLDEHPANPGGSGRLVVPTPVLGGRAGDPVPSDDRRVGVVYRQVGDGSLLVEYGAGMLDLGLRVRVHALTEALRRAGLPGILDLVPGLRSLQVRFDAARLSRGRLQAALEKIEDELTPSDTQDVPGRIVHLPLAWNDSSTRLAIEKYQQSVRADAPWCPSNIEFIRRVNGLSDIDDVRRTLFDASWLVMGLGAQHLGAPLATPLDPRHRLLAPPFNPPRKWTPENAVGLGGSGLGIQGSEGPGAWQLVGRTLQVWNRYRVTAEFEANRPWLLRAFDQIRFFSVSEAELAGLREDFPAGRVRLRIESTRFSLRQHHDFLRSEAASIHAFRLRQQAALAAERERWRATGDALEALQERDHSTRGVRTIPEGARTLATSVPGSLWKVLKRPGELFAAHQPVLVVESMKTEFPLLAPCAGRVVGLLCHEGASVTAGQDLLIYEPV